MTLQERKSNALFQVKISGTLFIFVEYYVPFVRACERACVHGYVYSHPRLHIKLDLQCIRTSCIMPVTPMCSFWPDAPITAPSVCLQVEL